MGRLQVNMLGASFAIRAKEEDAYLKKLLSYYQDITDTIQRTGNLNDPVQISILAGITLVDELYKAKQQNVRYDKTLNNANVEEAERIAMQMIEKIDAVL